MHSQEVSPDIHRICYNKSTRFVTKHSQELSAQVHSISFSKHYQTYITSIFIDLHSICEKKSKKYSINALFKSCTYVKLGAGKLVNLKRVKAGKGYVTDKSTTSNFLILSLILFEKIYRYKKNELNY